MAERNATRGRVSGLEPHRAYASGPEPLTYAGRRVVDGQTLALLRAGGEVLVMEVHPDQVARIGHFKTGQAVQVREGKVVSPPGGGRAARPTSGGEANREASHIKDGARRPRR